MVLFAIGFFVGLFQAHFMTAFGFLVLFGILMPNLAKLRRAAARNANKLKPSYSRMRRTQPLAHRRSLEPTG